MARKEQGRQDHGRQHQGHEQQAHEQQGKRQSAEHAAQQGRKVDLNTASKQELAQMPMVGEERAGYLIQHRPFKSWEDVEKVPGFSSGMIHDLQSGGAVIGSESGAKR